MQPFGQLVRLCILDARFYKVINPFSCPKGVQPSGRIMRICLT